MKLTDYTIKYLLKDATGNNLVNIVFDKDVTTETSITAGSYAWVGSPQNIGSSSFSFVNRTLMIDGQTHANSEITTGSCDVAVEGNVYTIVIKVEVLSTEYTLEYVGTIGDPNDGGETPGDGGETPGDGGETPGDGGETPGAGYENWVFTMSLNQSTREFSLTDGSRTVSGVLYGKYGLGVGSYIFNDTDGVFYATDIAVDGVAATTAEGYVKINNSYKMEIDATINGVKYTGTSTNGL